MKTASANAKLVVSLEDNGEEIARILFTVIRNGCSGGADCFHLSL